MGTHHAPSTDPTTRVARTAEPVRPALERARNFVASQRQLFTTSGAVALFDAPELDMLADIALQASDLDRAALFEMAR